MNISTSAQLAAQTFAAGAVPRPQATPRKIETSDLVDLASKPEAVAKTPAPAAVREALSPAAAAAPSAWSDARPARPGSRLDIKV